MALHPREATDESLLEVAGLANFAAERFRLTEPSVYRPPLQTIHSAISGSAIRDSEASPFRIPCGPAAARPLYAASSRTRSQDDDRGGVPAPVERDQAGDMGLHGYRRQCDLDSTGYGRPGGMSPFIGGDAEPRGDYFREGFHFSNTPNIATDSRHYPADFETARYIGQNTVNAITAAESPLPSRYTGTPQGLQGPVSREDKRSASKLTRLGGRRRRVLARWLQAIGAIVVAGGALGATFVRAQLFEYGHSAAPNGSRHS